MTLDTALQLTIGGLVSGSLYGLVLIGILLIYRVSRVVNFAHGQIGMVAAMCAFFLVPYFGLPIAVALGLGLAVAALVSYLVDILVISRVAKIGSGFDLIATLGVMMFLTAIVELVASPKSFKFFSLGAQIEFTFLGVYFNANDLTVIVTLAVVLGLLALVLNKTGLGLSIRAVAISPEIARTTGVNVQAVRAMVWAAGGAIAGVAAILIASKVTLNAFYMAPFLVKAFVAGIVGGLDRFVRPMAIAVGLGLLESWVVYWLGADARIPAVFLLIIAVLGVLPSKYLQDLEQRP
ncbi:hypothetical protein AL036_21465 [Salipiger aestuarii]|uniref:Branched-chain amino acid transport system permease protein n=1 Tax=Salipiger aestuarii TaxID=568098 RepID=A0A327XJI5_9RHOB|nr:branched-chain amino acid ABC transporter permease [Salipiger aestuarii]EIE52491.1 hypothetical protein C357_03410 [Citreicella sp. 357]KAA8604762.1 hypothetical protein AL036_21465 [Salipiger aestuarii]KAA8606480.1 hypothetical protein AL037_20290 [Salipiger aestuarii]KAB2532891.1 hypothetical protein AL035_20975 [Salipiger aestuarii]RAK08096.1 branched-chain amino acid transport system permease protein [Salipiger aestuarii]